MFKTLGWEQAIIKDRAIQKGYIDTEVVIKVILSMRDTLLLHDIINDKSNKTY